MKKLILLSIIIGFVACKSQQTSNNANPNLFGAAFTPKDVISVEQVQQMLNSKDTVTAMMSGTIESVCKKKGCWVNISPKTETASDIFVKFKDYGFFMPLDCDGREVIMNGIAYKEVTPVDELQHYAEDEGQTPEQIALITEPKEEYKFLADGVIMK